MRLAIHTLSITTNKLLWLAFQALAFLLISFQTLFGQTCLVRGQVTDYKTKLSVPARLVFEKQPDASLTVISESSQKGYRASLFDRGAYGLMVSAEGYVSEHLDFDLLADSLASKRELNYSFELIPIKLDDVLPFNKLLFEVTSFKITPGSIGELERLANIMKENPTIKIQLEGYTDIDGHSKSGKKLSQKRIEAIKEWLLKKGISKKRIKLRPVGGGSQVTGGAGADARKANRRVEIRVIEM